MQERFVTEYLVDMNATDAAMRAGYSETTARGQSHTFLSKPEIAQRIASELAKRAERVRLTADDVVRHVNEIVEADPRELTEYYRGACRYCFGAGFLYQRTPNEMRNDYIAFEANRKKAGAPQTFDLKGGEGFNPKRDPHPDCPECFGDGVGYSFIKDTRRLSPAAARLFKGVKETRNGVEIMLRDQDGAVKLLGEHLGAFSKRVELTGKNGMPIATTAVAVPELPAYTAALKQALEDY